MARICFEDITPGETTTYGDWRVTRDQIVDFARQYDPQPFHLDDAAAAASPIFGRLSASGWHTASATMRMMVDHDCAIGSGTMGSPGVEELRWIKPAYPDDTLTVRREVIEVRASQSRPEIGFVKSRVTTLNQHGDAVMSMVATTIIPTA